MVILFVVIGFWHGANYTFLIFGLLNGLYFVPRILARKNKRLRKGLAHINSHNIYSKIAMLFTFLLASLTVIFFRAQTIADVGIYFTNMLSFKGGFLTEYTLMILPLCLLFFAFEWIMKDRHHPFDLSNLNPFLRKLTYVSMSMVILLYGYFGEDPFYYFQF